MVMHLRVVSPPETTDAALELLTAAHTVTNIIVHRGAAVAPEGDVVIADVPREQADAILDGLRGLGLDRSGAIALDSVEVQISAGTDAAEEAAPGDADDAVLWDEVIQRTGEESRLSATFLLFIVIATIIAGIGVLLDQPILIVGAMVVGPEFGPLAALAIGIVRLRADLVGRSVLALVVGFLVAIVATCLVTWALDAFGLVSKSMLLADRPLTEFIWRPDALSWIVGFLAGIVGILSLTSAKSGALIGVVISVTTVPAAGNVGVALAYGVGDEAWGSLGQLLINLSAIVVGALLTLLGQRVARRLRSGRPR
jgi:uncharacterized hydrophobic protein (TIGR00271 family)